MNSLRPFFGAAAMTALALVTGARTADAAGFALRENSAVGLGTAFAGAASAANDLATIFSNPAGMTHFSQSGIEGVASEIVPHVSTNATATGLGGAPIAGLNTQNPGQAELVPGLYGLWSVTPDFKVGIAVTSPFGFVSRYDSGWVGRFNATDTSLRTVDINPNVAYRINPWLSIGGGVSAQHEDVQLDNSVSLAPTPFGDASADLKGDDWGYGFNLGGLVEPSPDTRIGLAYRSQVYHSIQGNVQFTNVPAAVAAFFPNSGAKAQLRTPDNVTLSVTHDYSPRFSVSADLQWTHWTTFNNLTVVRTSNNSVLTFTPENWNNTWFGAVGATYHWTDELALRAGVAYDQSPVSDQFRTSRIPDSDRYWLSIGLGYQLNPATSLDIGYAHIFLKDASISEPFSIPLAASTGTLNASYRTHIDIVAVSAKVMF